MTIGERLGHGVQEAVDRFGDVLLGEARSLGDLVHDIGLRHHFLLGPPARDVRDVRVPEAGRAVPYPPAPTLSIPSWTRGYLDSAGRVGSAAAPLGGRSAPPADARRPPARGGQGAGDVALMKRGHFFALPLPQLDQSDFCISVMPPATSNVNACFFAKYTQVWSLRASDSQSNTFSGAPVDVNVVAAAPFAPFAA